MATASRCYTHPLHRWVYSPARSVWRFTAPGPCRKWSWTCGRLWSSRRCTTFEGTSPSCAWRRTRACARPQLLALALAALGRPSCCLPATSAVTATCSSCTRCAVRLLFAQADGRPALPLTECGRAGRDGHSLKGGQGHSGPISHAACKRDAPSYSQTAARLHRLKDWTARYTQAPIQSVYETAAEFRLTHLYLPMQVDEAEEEEED